MDCCSLHVPAAVEELTLSSLTSAKGLYGNRFNYKHNQLLLEKTSLGFDPGFLFIAWPWASHLTSLSLSLPLCNADLPSSVGRGGEAESIHL